MTRLVTVLGPVIVLAAGYAVGGQAGLFALVALAAVVAVLAARLRIPPSHRQHDGNPRRVSRGFAVTGALRTRSPTRGCPGGISTW